VRLTPRRVGAVGLAALGIAACAKPAPIVQHNTYAKTSGLFERIAIAPLQPSPRMLSANAPGGVSGVEAAELVSRFLAEAIEERGVQVIPASDTALAIQGASEPVSLSDPRSVAALVARKFGATSIVLGQVTRYREREGGAGGAFRPASVGFVLTLYSAPEALRVWSARFDETQQSLSANVARARKYPGRGTRWLTAAELARWGIENAIAALPPSVR
jgi:hypothetical protein